MCSFVLASLLKISLCQKEGSAVMVAGFLHYLTISICFPFPGSEGEELTSPRLPYAVREVQLI